jgi:hypothetical protein
MHCVSRLTACANLVRHIGVSITGCCVTVSKGLRPVLCIRPLPGDIGVLRGAAEYQPIPHCRHQQRVAERAHLRLRPVRPWYPFGRLLGHCTCKSKRIMLIRQVRRKTKNTLDA